MKLSLCVALNIFIDAKGQFLNLHEFKLTFPISAEALIMRHM